MSGLGAPWGIERRKGTAKEWIRLTRRLLSLPSHGREVSSHQINTILDAQQQRDTEARGKPAVLSSIYTRNAAYHVVRWCVFRAVAKDAVARDAELRSVLQRLTSMKRSGASVADMISLEHRQVYLINRLHDAVCDHVDELIQDPTAGADSD